VAVEKSGWREKKRRGKRNGKCYGIGLASAIHVAGNRNVLRSFDGSSAIVQVNELGRALVISGELDIGQGSQTVFAQIAAEELGMTLGDIEVLPVDTEVSPFALGTFGDRITVLGGQAVKIAAEDARRQLVQHASKILEMNTEELELRGGKFFVKGSTKPVANLKEIARQVVLKQGGLPVIGKGIYTVPDYVAGSDPESQYGNYSIAYTFLTQIAEVRVDPETGEVEVLDIWSAIDLGKAVNPKACEAQVEGGVMMGLGFALREEYVFREGRVLNPNLHDYRVPSFSDLPRVHSFFIETVDPATPYGAKSVGEAIGDPTAAAVANAVYDAVGVRMENLPLTPERIAMALRRKKEPREKRDYRE
jgi:CO/xanthine dehydrogenase Mo-binding subunit